MAKRSDPSVDKAISKRVRDELADACINDWLEVAIVITLLTAMSGGAYFMYLLYQLSKV